MKTSGICCICCLPAGGGGPPAGRSCAVNENPSIQRIKKEKSFFISDNIRVLVKIN
jgi:hypothetical protein